MRQWGRRSAGEGRTVTLLDRKSPDEASDWVDQVSANGKANYVQADVTDRSSVESVLAAIDPLDVVVSNAGIVIPVPFLDVTLEQWHQHLDINLTGCFNVGQTAARLMVSRGEAWKDYLYGILGRRHSMARRQRLFSLEGGRQNAGQVDGEGALVEGDSRERRGPRAL